MELKELTIEEMETRKAEISTEIDGIEDMETLEARKAEIEAINAELESRKAEEAEKAEIRQAVAEGAGTVIRTFVEEKKEMRTPEEIRASN